MRKPKTIRKKWFKQRDDLTGEYPLTDFSRIPSFAEPFFLNFSTDCEFRIAMPPKETE
jgi:hypothetical protein